VRLINRFRPRIMKSVPGLRMWGNSGISVLTIFLLLASVILSAGLTGVQVGLAQEAVPVTIIDADGRVITSDPPPIMVEDRILVPISTLAASLQAKADWDDEQRTVTLTRGIDTVRVRVDSAEATMNGQEFSLGAAVYVVNDRAYVPLEPMAEALGAKLEWNETARTVKLLPGTAKASSSQVRSGPGPAKVPATTLTIKAGYFGTPYKTMKVFTFDELEAMPQVQQAYTFIDSMPSVILDSAQGVRLTDIMLRAGIDVNSIDTFYFYTTDLDQGWYQSLPKSFLLDTKRYYYPNLPGHWDSDGQTARPGATDGAVTVEPIIAVRDYWKRFATSPDFSQMTESNGFRLVFGQVDTSTCTAARSARWIREISVMLTGNPPSGVTLNRYKAQALIGSSFQLVATVGPADAANKSVTWASSNPEVASVDQNGCVSVISPGTASISVTTVEGQYSASCMVNGPSLSGAGSKGSGLANGGEKSETSSVLDPRQRLLAEKSSIKAGRQTGKVFEMSVDTVPLQPQAEHGNLNIPAAWTSLILFLLGAAKRYTEYKKEADH